MPLFEAKANAKVRRNFEPTKYFHEKIAFLAKVFVIYYKIH